MNLKNYPGYIRKPEMSNSSFSSRKMRFTECDENELIRVSVKVELSRPRLLGQSPPNYRQLVPHNDCRSLTSAAPSIHIMSNKDEFDILAAYQQVVGGCCIKLRRCNIDNCNPSPLKKPKLQDTSISNRGASGNIAILVANQTDQNNCVTPLLQSSPYNSEDDDDAATGYQCTSSGLNSIKPVHKHTVSSSELVDRLNALYNNATFSSPLKKQGQIEDEQAISELNNRFSKKQTSRKSTYRPSAETDQRRKETLERVKLKSEKKRRHRHSSPDGRSKKLFKHKKRWEEYNQRVSTSSLFPKASEKNSSPSDWEQFDIKPFFEVPEAPFSLPEVSRKSSLSISPEWNLQIKSTDSQKLPLQVITAASSSIKHVSGSSPERFAEKDFSSKFSSSAASVASSLTACHEMEIGNESKTDIRIISRSCGADMPFIELESSFTNEDKTILAAVKSETKEKRVTLPVTIDYESRPSLYTTGKSDLKKCVENINQVTHSSIPKFGPSISVSRVQPTDEKESKVSLPDLEIEPENLSSVSHSIKIKNEPVDLTEDDTPSEKLDKSKIGLIKIRSLQDLGITNPIKSFATGMSNLCYLPSHLISSPETDSTAVATQTTTASSSLITASTAPAIADKHSGFKISDTIPSGMDTPRDPRLVNKPSAQTSLLPVNQLPVIQPPVNHSSVIQPPVTQSSSITPVPTSQLISKPIVKSSAGGAKPNPRIQALRNKIDEDLRKISVDLFRIFKEYLKKNMSQKKKGEFANENFNTFRALVRKVTRDVSELAGENKERFQKNILFYTTRLLSYTLPARALNNDEASLFLSLMTDSTMPHIYTRSLIYEVLIEREKVVSLDTSSALRQNQTHKMSNVENLITQNIQGVSLNPSLSELNANHGQLNPNQHLCGINQNQEIPNDFQNQYTHNQFSADHRRTVLQSTHSMQSPLNPKNNQRQVGIVQRQHLQGQPQSVTGKLASVIQSRSSPPQNIPVAYPSGSVPKPVMAVNQIRPSPPYMPPGNQSGPLSAQNSVNTFQQRLSPQQNKIATIQSTSSLRSPVNTYPMSVAFPNEHVPQRTVANAYTSSLPQVPQQQMTMGTMRAQHNRLIATDPRVGVVQNTMPYQVATTLPAMPSTTMGVPSTGLTVIPPNNDTIRGYSGSAVQMTCTTYSASAVTQKVRYINDCNNQINPLHINSAVAPPYQQQYQEQQIMEQQNQRQMQIQSCLQPQSLYQSQLQQQSYLQMQQQFQSQLQTQLHPQISNSLLQKSTQSMQPMPLQQQQQQATSNLATQPIAEPVSVPYINSSQSPSPSYNAFDSLGGSQRNDQPVSVNVVQSTSRTTPERTSVELDFLCSKEIDKADYTMFKGCMELFKEFYKVVTMSQCESSCS